MTTVPAEPMSPSSGQLVKATVAAAFVAAAVLVAAVLPAEYGMDPTGIGRVLGLTAMGTQKAEGAPEPASPATEAAACVSSTARTTIVPDGTRKDSFELTLPPEQGAEIKAFMKSGDEIAFEWSTGGPELYFDFHGEAFDAAEDDFTSYETGTKGEASGTFRPAFEGRHGWYWRNDTTETVTVRLHTSGRYDDVKKM